MVNDKKVLFVTSNKLKFSEALNYCRAKGLNIDLQQEEADTFEVQTKDPKDICAVALHKGKQAWDKYGHPIIVEYTGLFFHKYGNFPGSLTKHVFKGIGYRGIFRLVDSGDGVKFISMLTYVDEYGNATIFDGEQDGCIIKPEKLEINSEFPFDQVFIPQGFSISYEELQKNMSPEFERDSYRLNAWQKLVAFIKKTNNH